MARAPQFDLCHLKAEHGGDAVNEALQIRRQAELKASLSVSGERCRRHYARADERATQAAFQPNKLVSNQQRLRFLQIARVETFSEPAVDRSQQFASLLRLALRAPEARHAHCGAT